MEYAIKTLKSELSICETVLDKIIDSLAGQNVSDDFKPKMYEQMKVFSDKKHQLEKAIKILCSEKTEQSEVNNT